ncbi:unnamed protein product, partial [marine sediment metagenome]
GKDKYPENADGYWIMAEVAKGSSPKDVFVEIWVLDLSDNEVAYTSDWVKQPSKP